MACLYFVNENWISENQFKELLNNGLLDNLISNKTVDLKGFKIDKSKILSKETKEIRRATIPARKLADILAHEVRNRQGYPANMLSALELNIVKNEDGTINEALTDFKIPLWASPYANKFESLLTSVVSNKVVKQKLPGNSFVLGSEEGFRVKEGDEATGELENSNIVFTEGFDPVKGLQPLRWDPETKTMLPAQIMIPFKFRDESGEILELKNFIKRGEDGRMMLDHDKVPKKLMQLFGFRIPTQKQNSMAAVEIVGFLPEASGDLVLAPRDFTKQMGSDFDVDKLYTYMYNHFYKDGKLHTNFVTDKNKIETLLKISNQTLDDLKDEFKLSKEDRKLIDAYIQEKIDLDENGEEVPSEIAQKASDIISKSLSADLVAKIDDAVNTISILNRSYKASRQNKILDIHLQVMLSTNPEVIAAIIALDSSGEFKKLSEDVNKTRMERGLVPPITTILSETYQRTKFINATAGKNGVGSFSLDSTLNAAAQGKDLVFMNLSKEDQDALFKDPANMPTSAEVLAANMPLATFGDNISRGDLSNKYTIRSQRVVAKAKTEKRELTQQEKDGLKLKSGIIRALQSAAVDNEKEQILDKLNINDETFDVIRALALLGFEEDEISGLLTQEIIWEYVDKLKDSRSSLTPYNPNAENEIFRALAEKYDPAGKFDSLSAEEIEKLQSASAKDLMQAIEEKTLQPIADKKTPTPDFNLQQLALLDKFQTLTETGKTIKQLQSSINTASKGVPKSLLEVQAKVKQIQDLPGSNIFNSANLLGKYDGNGNLIMPTTISGFASKEGTMFANTIYNKYFPYQETGFRTVVGEIIKHLPQQGDMSLSKQTEIKTEIFNEMRSYLYSNTDSNLFNEDPDVERARLFIDTATNKSLARILQDISQDPKNTWFQKNGFLNKLDFSLNKNGLVSRINFEAAAGENYDERDIYDGFLYLLDKNFPVGTFNGIEYTSRMLAQELVAAAYLEGGTQGAKQYLKYIPVAYLKSLGFGDYLSRIPFDFTDTFYGNLGQDGPIYSMPSAFARQYFQNNPGRAKSFNTSQLVEKKLEDVVELIPDAITNNFVEVLDPLTGEPTLEQTRFIAFADNKLPGGFAIYEFDSASRKYNRISTLAGSFDFVQYNSENNNPIPIERANRTTAPAPEITTPGYNIKGATAIPSKTFNIDTVNNTAQTDTADNLEIKRGLAGKPEALDNLLNVLEDSDGISSLNRSLIELIRGLELPKGFNIQYDKSQSRGSYNYGTNTLNINLDHVKHQDINILATTVVHELIHSLTSESISKYQDGDLESLTAKQIESIEKLESLRSKYIDQMIATEGPEGFDTFVRLYNNWKAAQGDTAKIEAFKAMDLTEEKMSKYYGAMKLSEFVTMALTDVSFQEHLNSLKDEDGVSIWDMIKEALAGLLNALGLDIKPGSALASAVKSSMDLIEANQKAAKPSDLFTTKIDQFNYSYNPETRQVIHNAKTGDKVETNDRQVNKVLVQYALANNFEQRTYNDQTYIEILHDGYTRVLNINNANEVSPETWDAAGNATQPTVSAGLPGPETKINIYAGTGENAELSNFAVRPFKSTVTVNTTFNTVEGAFQAAKFRYSSMGIGDRMPIMLELANTTGAEAKKLGRTIKGLDTKAWDENSSRIMKALIKESFEQNPDALAKLLATGNATLTHTQDKGKWGTEFPKLLMEVRDELRGTEPTVFSARKTYSGKVTKLEPNQIFVFGSNPEGRHGAGAAKYAKDNFGAVYGQGEGLQGQAYALPTKDLRIKANNSLRSISPEDITENIKKLYEVAKQNPTKEFLVSNYSESNLNGYTGQEMANMFNAAGSIPSNIVFNENFDNLISTTQPTVKPVVEPTENKFEYKGKSIDTAFPLTKGQEKALESLVDFVKQDTEHFITLQGAAGTGKTAVIGYLQKYFKGESTKFLYMAPTHAATAELAFATVKTGNKKLPMTVQSSVSDNVNRITGEREVGFTKKVINEFGYTDNIIVIDEASMLSSKDYENLKEAIKKHDVKIIFMGDILQIPEVSTANPTIKQVSKAFQEPEQLTLTEVKRTESDSILKVLTALRTSTNSMIPMVENNEELKFLSGREYNKELVKTFKEDSEDSVLIGYTNNSVQANNLKIRELLGRTGDLQTDDTIVGYLGYSSKQIERGNIANSVRYTVSKVKKEGSAYQILAHSKKLENLKEKGVLGVEGDASGIYYQLSPSDSFKFEELTQEDFNKNNRVISDIFKKLYLAKQAALENPRGWKDYYTVLASTAKKFESILVGGEYIYNPSTDQMEAYESLKHSQLKKKFSELYIDKAVDFGHAVTIHKSQGSTVKNVFFDATTLPKGDSAKLFKGNTQVGNEKHSLIYVGMSRASNKLVVNTENPSNFYDLEASKPKPFDFGAFKAVANAEEYTGMPTFTGEEKDQGPSPDELDEFRRLRNQDEMISPDSPISKDKLEKYTLICGK